MGLLRQNLRVGAQAVSLYVVEGEAEGEREKDKIFLCSPCCLELSVIQAGIKFLILLSQPPEN